jgi:DGQHR domain-containing protein
MSVRIDCLKSSVTTGGHSYPVFVGFLPAEAILKIAAAPSFEETASHESIADNVLRPPVELWQRPLDKDRVNRIADVFSTAGNIMPNPVLLSENTVVGPSIAISQQLAAGGIPTNIWQVHVDEPKTGEAKPLWILDGQHRINGLARSSQKDNPVPMVLLLNDGVAVYQGGDFARIFAQVTTSAQELDKLHNEWLTFAFNLENYDPSRSATASEQKQAMRVVAELCRMSSLPPPGAANPGFNRVAFNMHLDLPKNPSFFYGCDELQDLVHRHYYSRSASSGHLDPEIVAQQLGFAVAALQKSVPAPQSESVFFGDGDFAERYMQSGLLVGVMSRLLEHGVPPDWSSLLTTLKFPTTDWNFRSWRVSFHGGYGTTSKKMALEVFHRVFRDGVLPAGARNLAEFLRGNEAWAKLVFSHLTPAGKASKKDQSEIVIKAGQTLSEDISPRRHVRLLSKSENVGAVKFVADKLIKGKEYPYPIGTGMILDPKVDAQPLNVVVHMTHYGGNESHSQVTLKW